MVEMKKAFLDKISIQNSLSQKEIFFNYEQAIEKIKID
jgi:hypothetical protein